MRAGARYEETEKGRDCYARQIRMSAGGINFYVGAPPTIDAADYLRDKIKREAPSMRRAA